MDIFSTQTLRNGVSIPCTGMGLWQINGEEATAAIRAAVALGYRHFDTAMYYKNEPDIGRALKACGAPRAELFITSKLWPSHMQLGLQRETFCNSLKDLGLDYLDLYLLHWPIGDVDESWAVLEALYDEGLVRSIGVSNFLPPHLERLTANARILPMVDQLESNPYYVQDAAVRYAQSQGVVVEAWGPLGKGKTLCDPVVLDIAARLGATPAQVVLKYHLQRNVVVIPKSIHEQRLRENAEAGRFTLTDEDMARLTALDTGATTRYYPAEFDPWDYGVIPETGMAAR